MCCIDCPSTMLSSKFGNVLENTQAHLGGSRGSQASGAARNMDLGNFAILRSRNPARRVDATHLPRCIRIANDLLLILKCSESVGRVANVLFRFSEPHRSLVDLWKRPKLILGAPRPPRLAEPPKTLDLGKLEIFESQNDARRVDTTHLPRCVRIANDLLLILKCSESVRRVANVLFPSGWWCPSSSTRRFGGFPKFR